MPGASRHSERRLGGLLLLTMLCAMLASCSDDASTCVQELGESCQPLYQPLYAEVFQRTLMPRCALQGGSCHSREGAKGGLIMDDADETYEALVGSSRVLSGDTACSPLLVRIGSEGPALMPPGAALSEAERCAMETWVRNGAEK